MSNWSVSIYCLRASSCVKKTITTREGGKYYSARFTVGMSMYSTYKVTFHVSKDDMHDKPSCVLTDNRGQEEARELASVHKQEE